MQSNKVEHKQQSLSSVLIALHPIPRLAIGIVSIAFFTRYAALIPITWAGRWSNALFDPFELSVVCTILIVQSVVSQKTRRDKQVTAVLYILLTALTILPMLFSRGWHNTFIDNWPSVVYPIALLLLNRYLFLRYKKTVELD